MIAHCDVIEKETTGFKELHARRLVESVGHILIGYLLMQAASKHAEEYLHSARIYLRLAEGKVADAARVVLASTAEDLSLYRIE